MKVTIPGSVEHSSVIAASNTSAADSLSKAVLLGERFMALTGEPGIRRSSIVDTVVIGLADSGVRVVRVRNSAPGPLRVGRLIVLILGGQQTRGVDDGLQRVLRVVTDPVHRGKRLVLVIEGADELDRPALEMLKFLPDVRREGSPCAQILLAGRAGFWMLLADRTHASVGVLAASAELTPALGRKAAAPNADRGIRGDENPAPVCSLKTSAPRRALRFLRAERGLQAGLPLLVIASGIAALVLVAYGAADRSSAVRPAAVRQEASRSAPAEGSTPTPVGSKTAVSGTNVSGVGSTLIRTSRTDPMPTTAADQQTAGRASPPSPTGSAAAMEATTHVPQMRAGLDMLPPDTNRVQRDTPGVMPGAKIVEHSPHAGRFEPWSVEPSGERRRPQPGMDAGPLPGASPRERSLLLAELVSFRGPVNNETLHRAGRLSLIIRSQGSSGPIRARFDAGDGLLGSGELEGNLSESGRISVSGQLMVGKNPFMCDLSGVISGDKLIGSANFVHTSNGRVAHSTFTLTRS